MTTSPLHNNDIQLTHVVAFDNNRAIGSNNQLPWHIPEDLAHFKRITAGGVVLMGRKTFDSIGRPLPNRTNIVISRDSTWQGVDGVLPAHNIDDALVLGKEALGKTELVEDKNTLFVIGGEQIYRQTLDFATTLEITHVITDIKNPDAFYPALPKDFVQTFCSDVSYDDKSGIGFYFATYQKSP